MPKVFYSHLVDIDSVLLALEDLEITVDEKEKLSKLAEDQLHHVIVDAILNELSPRDKKVFLANLKYEAHDKIWKHLNEKVDKIEAKIVDAAEALKKDLHADIKDL